MSESIPDYGFVPFRSYWSGGSPTIEIDDNTLPLTPDELKSIYESWIKQELERWTK